ncbi:unnamed protein product, partial [Amoebophrya sp. A25]
SSWGSNLSINNDLVTTCNHLPSSGTNLNALPRQMSRTNNLSTNSMAIYENLAQQLQLQQLQHELVRNQEQAQSLSNPNMVFLGNSVSKQISSSPSFPVMNQQAGVSGATA